jgi:hypothetical protein
MKRFALQLLALSILVVPAGCRKEPTPTLQPTPIAASPLGQLRVDKAEVRYRASEDADAQSLDPSTEIEVPPGAVVTISGGGRAQLAWSGFLNQEMLDGTDLLVSLAEPERRAAILDQAAGTSRYRLQGDGDAAEVTVQAGWAQVVLSQGIADLIVSFIPGDPASVWIAVLDGEAVVREGALGDPAVDSAETLTVAEGQVIGLVEGRPLPDPMAVDRAAVDDWYRSHAAGSDSGSIAGVALVCEVRAGGPLLDAPAGEATELTAATGDRVRILERDSTATWARIIAASASSGEGAWISAASLECNGPIEAAPADLGTDPTATPVATPTLAATLRPVLGPTRTSTATSTPGGTATPTPTLTPTGVAVEISFSVDTSEVDPGQCTTLRWHVKGVREVHIRPGIGGVVGEPAQSREVCPSGTTEYVLEATLLDGTTERRTVRVTVREPVQPTATEVLTLPTLTHTPEPVDTPIPPTETPDPALTSVAPWSP